MQLPVDCYVMSFTAWDGLDRLMADKIVLALECLTTPPVYLWVFELKLHSPNFKWFWRVVLDVL